jgi:hypothetical protein
MTKKKPTGSGTVLQDLAFELLEARGHDPGSGQVPQWARRAFVSLADVGIEASTELVDYMDAAEDKAFREAIAGLLSDSPRRWNVHPMRPAKSLLFASSPSHVVAFLAGAEPMAEDPDDGAVLVASWGVGEARSPVASFLFNDVAPSDPEPGDFVLEAESIEGLMRSGGAGDAGAKAKEIRSRFERGYRRGIWLAQMIFDEADWYCDNELDDIVAAASHAARPRSYEAERALVASRPDVAAYWLLSHALLGQAGKLAEVLRAVVPVTHPLVVDLRKKLAPIARGKPVTELLRKHRPELDGAALDAIRRAAGWA